MKIDEFMTLPHMAFNASDPESSSLAEEHFARLGYASRIVTSTSRFVTAVFSIQATSLVTLIPRRLGELLQDTARIRLVDPPFELPPLDEELVWNPRFTASAAHKWVRKQLVDLASSL